MSTDIPIRCTPGKDDSVIPESCWHGWLLIGRPVFPKGPGWAKMCRDKEASLDKCREKGKGNQAGPEKKKVAFEENALENVDESRNLWWLGPTVRWTGASSFFSPPSFSLIRVVLQPPYWKWGQHIHTLKAFHIVSKLVGWLVGWRGEKLNRYGSAGPE